MKAIVLCVCVVLAGCTEPGSEESPDAAQLDAGEAEDPTPGFTRVVLFARFFRGGVEVPCGDIDQDLEASALGHDEWSTVTVFHCFASIHSDPERRYFTAVYHLDFLDEQFSHGAMAVHVNGAELGGESVVSISAEEHEFGFAERWITLVLD